MVELARLGCPLVPDFPPIKPHILTAISSCSMSALGSLAPSHPTRHQPATATTTTTRSTSGIVSFPKKKIIYDCIKEYFLRGYHLIFSSGLNKPFQSKPTVQGNIAQGCWCRSSIIILLISKEFNIIHCGPIEEFYRHPTAERRN